MLRITMKAARTNAGLTIKEMSRLMEKSANTINDWELGRKEPRVSELRRYCDICGCSPDDITFDLPRPLEKS